MLENKINTAMGTKPSKSGHSTLLQIRADKIVPYKVQVGKKVCTMQKCTVGWEVRLPVSGNHRRSYNMVEIMHINH